MGFNEGGIILDREDETYYTGQFVRGRLEFDLSNVKTFRSIYLDFKGFCKVHWTTSHSRRENDRTVHYTVVHESYEEYINVTTYLVGGKSGEQQLTPGNHVFPFEFLIPPHCPSSYEGSDGHVRYEVKATVDRAFKLDQHKTAMFRVLAPVDLNANPYCKEPIGMEFYQSYCCWCMSAGKSEVTVKVPAGGACPRQLLPIEVSCKNNSGVEIKSIKFQIKENKVFHAHSEPDTRSYNETMLEVKKGPVPAHTERNWVVEMELPDMDVPNLMGCRFIDVDYKFKVKVDTAACHEDDEEARPFIIGTIPLKDFDNPPIAPTDNTPVSQGITPYPIMNQPSAGNPPYPNGPNSPYPAPGIGINPPQNPPYPVSPYPNTDPPYPNANPPYPNANPPYPNANPPYPNANPPYPNASPYPNPAVGNSQYPQGTSPYPTPKVPSNAPYPTESNSPYPPATSPYPPATSPYPPATSPYPPATSPYPSATSPYPPATSPYPPTTSPYPPTNNAPYGTSPKPEFTGTTLLKTGNLGFIAQGNNKDGATMPLLPPSARVPTYPTSPYASATAPEPSTPDDEGKKLSDDLPTHSTPFNPQYKDKSDEK